MIVEQYTEDGVEVLHDSRPVNQQLFDYWSHRHQHFAKLVASLPRCKERQQAAFERDKALARVNRYRRSNGS